MNSHLEDKDIPKKIKIQNFVYYFKQRLTNFKFSYRCKTRKCGIWRTIDEENLKKIIHNDPHENIQFKKNQKDHICYLTNIDIKGSQITTIPTQIKLAEEIINKNLDKSLICHIDNLSKNNIILKNQIKSVLEKMKEFNYAKDENNLNDISLIKISSSSTNRELQNLPFCFSKNFIINIDKKKDKKAI